ncbi:hypothetical protein GQX74_006571 [Glossina fuscipes]|nr:hypothetical protein GQX74_006571 [Glossina fuscipes]
MSKITNHSDSRLLRFPKVTLNKFYTAITMSVQLSLIAVPLHVFGSDDYRYDQSLLNPLKLPRKIHYHSCRSYDITSKEAKRESIAFAAQSAHILWTPYKNR